MTLPADAALIAGELADRLAIVALIEQTTPGSRAAEAAMHRSAAYVLVEQLRLHLIFDPEADDAGRADADARLAYLRTHRAEVEA